jgi:DamX protein
MSLHPDCLAQLKLQHPPFDGLPSEDFVYSDPLLEELVTAASEAVTAPGAILLLTGENGSGRSMLLMRILGSLPDNFELIAFRARPNTQFEAVDFTIRNHLRAAGAEDPDRALTDLLAERIHDGIDPVIAVDDAHQLGMDLVNILLRMRAEILVSEGRAPRLILSGDPVLLRRRLQLHQADEDQVARFQLRPFSFEQTEAYLRHRLRAAGMSDPGSVLTEDVVADLQAASNGLPEALNTHANAWLERLCGAGAGQTAVTAHAGMPEREPGTAGLSEHGPETVAGAAVRLRADDEDRDPGTWDQEADQEREASAVPFWSRTWFVPAVATLVAFLILAPFARHLFERTPAPAPGSTVELPLPVLPEPAPEHAEPEPQLEDRLAAVSEPGPDEDAGILEVPFDDRHPAEMPGPGAPGGSFPDPAPEPPPEARPEPRTEPRAEAQPEPRAEPAPRPPAEQPARAEPSPAAAAPAAPPPAGADLAADREWLGRQNRGHYTIQLIAAQTLPAARSFVEQHQLSGIRYIQTRSGGQNFVIALAGSFPSRSAAEAAVSNLPAGVRENQPWIRSIGSVQEIQR